MVASEGEVVMKKRVIAAYNILARVYQLDRTTYVAVLSVVEELFWN